MRDEWDPREYLKKYLFRLSMASPVAYPTTPEADHANFDNKHVAVIRRSPPRPASATDTGLVKTLSSI